MTAIPDTLDEGEIVEHPGNGNAIMPIASSELTLNTAPADVLRDAHLAAKALIDVINGKKKPVRFNGEVYLEFEDLQTVARFYGVTAKVIDVRPIEVGGASGWIATAEAIRDGRPISSAVSMCLNDEQNWKNKPQFQLMSMAQTRACAKSIRNVLSWVVVLAGYRPTPAEEMTHTNPDEIGEPIDQLLWDTIVAAGKAAPESRKIEFYGTFLPKLGYQNVSQFTKHGAEHAMAALQFLEGGTLPDQAK